MLETLQNISMVVFFVSIFGMFFFMRVKFNKNIAKWFYLAFGLSILPLMPKLLEDDDVTPLMMIWPGLFSLVGIVMFILMSLNKDK